MCKIAHLLRAVLLAALATLAAGNGKAVPIMFGSLNASLDTGSLAGVTFPVTFSYDASQINAIGDSFIPLNSFDFTLLGTEFSRNEIFQGGQVIFLNGALDNVTASYQVFLPLNAPVDNITFGFGGPGVIGYIDLAGTFGTGSFRFTPVPEPGTLVSSFLAVGGLLLWCLYTKRA
jgi:hypothetical protein